jgi:hypothetical protein
VIEMLIATCFRPRTAVVYRSLLRALSILPFPLLVLFVLVLFPSCIPQMVYVNVLRWDQSSTVTAASLFCLPKSQLLARTLPYMTCRRTRKPRRLRSTPKSGSLGVVVGLAGVSFLLIRISEISGGRTVSLRCNPLGLSYGQHSTALSPVVLVASQLFRRITSLQLQVTTRSRSAKREEMSSNIPSTSIIRSNLEMTTGASANIALLVLVVSQVL